VNTERTKYLHRKVVNGKTYVFFRYRGKLTALPPENSDDFRRAYDKALRTVKLAESEGQVIAPRRQATESINAAIDLYLDSAAFDQLARSSKLQYLHTLKTLRATLGAAKLADLDADAVSIYTDRLAKRHGMSVADRHMRIISKIWKVCRKYPQFALKGKANPTGELETVYRVKQKHRPWSPQVQDAFMAGASAHMQLAKLLLHFSAQRGGDCVRMLWSDYDGEGLTVRPSKTHGDTEALPNYHLCPKPLRAALDAAPRLAPTILVNSFGAPYANANVLSHAFKRELVRLGLASHGARSVTMHGLRKTAAADVASLGVGAAGIKSITGHRTDGEANYYAKDADKRQINENVISLWDAALKRRVS
jgi:integrase